ncbi:MAG: putative monovalent cation/H+ antiporter subunit A [Desulfobacterales bacterium]|jgi:multicomponent Na+:H+ antiporter subunit A
MILAAVVSIFILALVAPWLQRLLPNRAGWVLGILPLALTVFFASKIPQINAGQIINEYHIWVPTLGASLSFYLDGLSLVFSLLICGVGALIVIYSGGYLSGHTHLGRFYTFMLFFMASMLGLVLAGNLISLFVFWELTSISSYFLIGFDHQRESARTAALQALLVTGTGGLVLLAGMLLMGWATGSMEISELLTRADMIRGNALYIPILILVLLGAFTKSAQVPFHFWLPSAMEGPAPVSAFLHSVTMVKAGVYLLLRLSPVLGGTEIWQLTLMLFGAATVVTGAFMALVQTDFKLLLAYSTVNGLGTLVFLTGVGTPLAIQAAMVFLVVHALYKGSLFLAAGVVDHETGSRDLTRLKGLSRQMPLITVATVLSAVSMAGLPPLLGFVGKELIYESILNITGFRWLFLAAAVLANAALLAAAAIIVLRPFFGEPETPQPKAHKLSLNLWLGPVLPALLGLILGLLPDLVSQSAVASAVSAVVARPVEMHLALWHGLTPMLALSGLTIVCGALIYLIHTGARRLAQRGAWLAARGPAAWYFSSLEGLKKLAAWQTRVLQSGYLHHYVLAIMLTTLALVGYTLVYKGGFQFSLEIGDIRSFELIVAILMLAAAFVTVWVPSRIGAIVAMGVIGYGLALIFVDFGAPDLAMTQFLIETMTVILFVLVIYRLPKFKEEFARVHRLRNALVAVASGLLMSVLVLVALSVREGSRLSGFFAENSYILAHGRNIVNVIIVDFRALDTLGEITVLALAGVGVYTLLKLKPEDSEAIKMPEEG